MQIFTLVCVFAVCIKQTQVLFSQTVDHYVTHLKFVFLSPKVCSVKSFSKPLITLSLDLSLDFELNNS